MLNTVAEDRASNRNGFQILNLATRRLIIPAKVTKALSMNKLDHYDKKQQLKSIWHLVKYLVNFNLAKIIVYAPMTR